MKFSLIYIFHISLFYILLLIYLFIHLYNFHLQEKNIYQIHLLNHLTNDQYICSIRKIIISFSWYFIWMYISFIFCPIRNKIIHDSFFLSLSFSIILCFFVSRIIFPFPDNVSWSSSLFFSSITFFGISVSWRIAFNIW